MTFHQNSRHFIKTQDISPKLKILHQNLLRSPIRGDIASKLTTEDQNFQTSRHWAKTRDKRPTFRLSPIRGNNAPNSTKLGQNFQHLPKRGDTTP